MAGVAPELNWHAAVDDFHSQCRTLISVNGHRFVSDVGGGRAPLLSRDEVASGGLEYTILDISRAELDLAPAGYNKVQADIGGPLDPSLRNRFDFVFSRFLAEHVRDGRRLHENIFAMLRPGGQAFHLFPTLFSPPFIANRLLPERIGHAVVSRVYRRSTEVRKFPARYSHCYGPTPRMTSFLRSMGYEIDEFRPFYGTPYLERIPVARALDARLNGWAARRRNPYMTSYVHLLLRKPAAAEVGQS